jgi:hypothetical protein
VPSGVVRASRKDESDESGEYFYSLDIPAS